MCWVRACVGLRPQYVAHRTRSFGRVLVYAWLSPVARQYQRNTPEMTTHVSLHTDFSLSSVSLFLPPSSSTSTSYALLRFTRSFFFGTCFRCANIQFLFSMKLALRLRPPTVFYFYYVHTHTVWCIILWHINWTGAVTGGDILEKRNGRGVCIVQTMRESNTNSSSSRSSSDNGNGSRRDGKYNSNRRGCDWKYREINVETEKRDFIYLIKLWMLPVVFHLREGESVNGVLCLLCLVICMKCENLFILCFFLLFFFLFIVSKMWDALVYRNECTLYYGYVWLALLCEPSYVPVGYTFLLTFFFLILQCHRCHCRRWRHRCCHMLPLPTLLCSVIFSFSRAFVACTHFSLVIHSFYIFRSPRLNYTCLCGTIWSVFFCSAPRVLHLDNNRNWTGKNAALSCFAFCCHSPCLLCVRILNIFVFISVDIFIWRTTILVPVPFDCPPAAAIHRSWGILFKSVHNIFRFVRSEKYNSSGLLFDI